MIYRQKNKRSTLGIKIVIFCVVLFALFRIFNINLTDGVLKNGFNYVFESKSAALSPLRNALVYFQSKKNLEESHKKLLAENTDLKLDVLTGQAMTQEFESFKSQFTEFATDTAPIKVILKPPFMPFDLVRLSGNLENYAEGSPVFYKNVIVGTLKEKTNRYGTVELFSMPNRITPALIKGVQFEAKGLGGGRYSLEVPKDFDIKEGDPILYPNERVILLGAVEQLESNEEDLFKKVFFNLPIPLDSISYVTIGTLQPYEQPEPTE
jgi:cell shape-determining protein MreC